MIGVWRYILSLWRARQRRFDMEFLWPQCIEQAESLDHAKAMFAIHCHNDPAWMEWDDEAVADFIDTLGPTTNLPMAARRKAYSESKPRA
jgi:hypothetical protein